MASSDATSMSVEASAAADLSRPKAYYAHRATNDMSQHLTHPSRTLQQTLALACRIIASKQEEAGLAGQISARSTRGPGYYWTLRFGLGWEEATPESFIEVDSDLNTVTGNGMANPATRFHIHIYTVRPDVHSIVHTHSPWTAVLAAAAQPLVIAQMDMTPFYGDCGFLAAWPGVPIAEEEGVIIASALGNMRSTLLAHHGMLTTGSSVEEAAYLGVYLERAARIQCRARAAFGKVVEVDGGLAAEAGAFLKQDCWVRATFEYWGRQCSGVTSLKLQGDE